MTNVLKTPIPLQQLDTIMLTTCSEFNQRYQEMKDFLVIQNELNSIPSDALIGRSTDLQIFKLLSLQQKISIQHKK
jgi:hypothetical protein